MSFSFLLCIWPIFLFLNCLFDIISKGTQEEIISQTDLYLVCLQKHVFEDKLSKY